MLPSGGNQAAAARAAATVSDNVVVEPPVADSATNSLELARASRQEDRAGNRRTGKAGRWNDDKGFGFIKPDDGGADVFVHRSALGESRDLRLETGVMVEFEEVYDERKQKTNAQKVSVIDGGGGEGRTSARAADRVLSGRKAARGGETKDRPASSHSRGRNRSRSRAQDSLRPENLQAGTGNDGVPATLPPDGRVRATEGSEQGVACKRSSVSSPDGNHRSKRRSRDPSSSRDRQREGKLQSDFNAKPVHVVSPRDSLAGGDSSPGLQSAVQSSQALASAQSAPPTPIFRAVPEPEQTVGGCSAKPDNDISGQVHSRKCVSPSSPKRR